MSGGGRLSRGAAALALTVSLAACAAAPAGPPQVSWGVDECSHCHMILSDQRYAAVARAADGEEARFDDVGCLVGFLAEREASGWQAWVRTGDDGQWLAAGAAWFARLESQRTPMGSGVVAFASPAGARAAGGAPLRWPELVASAAASAAREQLSETAVPLARRPDGAGTSANP